ncbi:hypothetical protein TRFO_36540 [Tritrichomonas foetus]|uniref:Nucleotide-diphospho-sugar transferase domain-containing protein n=1 Tax=Tritrichomonas foetus TaxID=1144522 RepID=A0A1J4JDM9_9EUKA|nr:hypothetical protein TRFO_36540 [Tritrichomonas foetus]|eukprot:OHS97302.1 hypothetical protein TRFO_36540 [Tritrichomonas foetus]
MKSAVLLPITNIIPIIFLIYGIKTLKNELLENQFELSKTIFIHTNIQVETEELFFLSNLNGKHVLSLFDLPLITNFLIKIPKQKETGKRLVISTIVSHHYNDTLYKCLMSAMHSGVNPSEFLIFALDEHVHNFCESIGIFSVILNYQKLYEHSWFVVGRLKQAIQYFINCCNCDLIFFDSDIVFTDNFKKILLECPDSPDIQIMDEKHNPRSEVDMKDIGLYNIGFMFVRSSPQTRHFFRKWLYSEYTNDLHLWDQGIFNYVMISDSPRIYTDTENKSIVYQTEFQNRTENVRIHILNPLLFINYCNLIVKEENSFDAMKMMNLIRWAANNNYIRPVLVHYACVEGSLKLGLMRISEYQNVNYQYFFDLFSNYTWKVTQ